MGKVEKTAAAYQLAMESTAEGVQARGGIRALRVQDGCAVISSQGKELCLVDTIEAISDAKLTSNEETFGEV
eukprot:792567-Prorocentrum_minimum.AAC.7